MRKWRTEVAAGGNPRDVKLRFAREIVARFHSRVAADRAGEEFTQRFRHGQLPEDIPVVNLEAPPEGLASAQVLRRAGLASSSSEASRLIAQGGVKIDGERISDRALVLAPGKTYLVQVGKLKVSRVKIS